MEGGLRVAKKKKKKKNPRCQQKKKTGGDVFLELMSHETPRLVSVLPLCRHLLPRHGGQFGVVDLLLHLRGQRHLHRQPGEDREDRAANFDEERGIAAVRGRDGTVAHAHEDGNGKVREQDQRHARGEAGGGHSKKGDPEEGESNHLLSFGSQRCQTHETKDH